MAMLKNSKKTAAKTAKTHLKPTDDKSDEAIGDKLGITITAPNFQTAEITVRGSTNMVQLMFGEKARNTMREKQAAGSTAKKGKREAKDFDEAFEQAIHRSRQGWCGIPASAIRAAMIRACTLVGFEMTKAKMCLFVSGDGYDAVEGTPLVKLFYHDEDGNEVAAEPHHVEHMVRNATGVADIRVRAMYDEGWMARIRIRFDADIFTPQEIANLLQRAGLQVGVGEGRPFSPKSCGMGWGQFELVQENND
jgi:hypothetical protein